VEGALADPFLELHNGDGDVIDSNDDWKNSPDGGAAVEATGLAPANVKESALLEPLLAGNYTAVVQGIGASSGVGLVEFYRLAPTASNLR
jgi:hypothetical protein